MKKEVKPIKPLFEVKVDAYTTFDLKSLLFGPVEIDANCVKAVKIEMDGNCKVTFFVELANNHKWTGEKEYAAIIIPYSLSIGYRGEGPRGLLEILRKYGFDETIVPENFIFEGHREGLSYYWEKP